MITLRPYQENAVNHAVEMLSERGNSLIVAGTGAGKTIMMAAVINKYCKGFKAEHGKYPHVLVLVHRTEIHDQNHSKFSLVCPDIATSEITALKKSVKGNVHFGMVQTVVGLLNEFEKANSYFDLIVIDEAHHSAASTYEEIIERNKIGKPNAALLGVTATPNRGDKLPLIHLYINQNDAGDGNPGYSDFSMTVGNIIQAYNSHASISISGIIYDFSNCDGHIDYVMCGHTHIDYIETIGGVPCIITANMKNGNSISSLIICILTIKNKKYRIWVFCRIWMLHNTTDTVTQ